MANAEHKRSLRDRLREADVRQFVRFCLSSLSATVIDQGMAWILFYVLEFVIPELDFVRILVSTLVARVLSVAFNFTVNQKRVFAGHDWRRTLPRFLILAVFIMLCSTTGVYLAHTRLGADERIAKLVVDFCLFFVNFGVQRVWVFRDKPPAE